MSIQVESKIDKVYDAICELTVLEMVSLQEKLKQEWGVTAIATAPVSPSDNNNSLSVSEKTEFDVILSGFDQGSKISLIKLVREVTGKALADAKKALDQKDFVIKSSVTKDIAEELKAKFTAISGTQITVK